MQQEFISNYEKLREKNELLPDFNELDSEYEISDLINEKKISGKFTQRNIRRSITYQINSHISHLHGIIMPPQHSAIAVEESGFFSEEDKEKIIKIISKLMVLLRESFECEIKKDKNLDIDFIIKNHQNWLELKKEILKITPKLIDGWKNSLENKK